jgi:hypothetical protein
MMLGMIGLTEKGVGMNRRKWLWGTVAGLGLFGLVMVAKSFVFALAPNARADNALFDMDVSQLQAGDFRILDNGSDASGFHGRLLVLRQYDGQLRVFVVSMSRGRAWLQEGHFPQWSYLLCNELGPDIRDGKLLPDGVIRCQDVTQDELALRSRWTYEGKSLNSFWANLWVPHYRMVGSHLQVMWHGA